jgi:hypothetical protein
VRSFWLAVAKSDHAFNPLPLRAPPVVRRQFLDELLQFSAPSPGDEQPDADGGVARGHEQNRGGGESCGYAASLGQRKRVAHIPTAETEAARSGLILQGQGQARLHLKSNTPWSREWGPVQRAVVPLNHQNLLAARPRREALLRRGLDAIAALVPVVQRFWQ